VSERERWEMATAAVVTVMAALVMVELAMVRAYVVVLVVETTAKVEAARMEWEALAKEKLVEEEVREKGPQVPVREVLAEVPVEGVGVAVRWVVAAEVEVVAAERAVEPPRRFPTLTRTGALLDCLSVGGSQTVHSRCHYN